MSAEVTKGGLWPREKTHFSPTSHLSMQIGPARHQYPTYQWSSAGKSLNANVPRLLGVGFVMNQDKIKKSKQQWVYWNYYMNKRSSEKKKGCTGAHHHLLHTHRSHGVSCWEWGCACILGCVCWGGMWWCLSRCYGLFWFSFFEKELSEGGELRMWKRKKKIKWLGLLWWSVMRKACGWWEKGEGKKKEEGDAACRWGSVCGN